MPFGGLGGGGDTLIINKTGSGATPAVDLDEIAPDQDHFLCAQARVSAGVMLLGVAVRMSTQGDVGTTSTLIGSLRVEDEDGVALCSDAVLVNFGAGTPINPAAGVVIGVANTNGGPVVAAGKAIRLYWEETGAIGDGTRPKFQFVGWQFA